MEYGFGGGDGGLSGDEWREMESSFNLSYGYCSPEELKDKLNVPVYPSCPDDDDWIPEDKAVVTPVLQYISDMLMDEQMEDRIFMLQECSAYQALAKDFYEILGESSSSFSSGTEGTGSVSLESDGADEWINGLLNLDPTTRTESTSTLSTGGTSVNPPEIATVEHSPEWLCSSSGSGYQAEGDLLPSFVCISDSSGSAFQSNELPHPHWRNGIGLQDDHLTPAGMLQAVPGVAGKKMLEDTIFQNDAFMRTIGSLDRPLNVEAALEIQPFATIMAMEQIDSGFNANRSMGNEFQYLLQKDEEYQQKAKAFPAVVQSSLESNTNLQRKHIYQTDFSGTPQDRALLAREVDNNPDFGNKWLRSADCWQVSSAATDTASSITKETLSFVKNRDLNAECCAKLFQDGSLPSCTLKKQDSVMAPSKQGSGTGSISKRSDKQFTVDLRSRLVSCAQAVAENSLRTAHELLQEIRQHASPYGTATERLAFYFAEALDARIAGTGPALYTAIANNRPSAAKMLKSYLSYVEVCPLGTLSHFFANQTILNAAEGASRLHIVDYGILYGFQWPCLMGALVERKGGPPHLRITGIEFPHPGRNPEERVQATGVRLREYAKAYGVPFEYHAIASKWETIQPTSLKIRQEELLIVNCMNRLRHLMDETVIAANPRNVVLSKIRSMNPKLYVQGMVNAGLNSPFFTSRFKEALFYYSSKLDILETNLGTDDNPERLMVEQELIGRDILNVVACEGLERVERPETYKQCHVRTQRAGFVPLPLDPTVMSKGRAILKSYHKEFEIDSDGKWLLLGWKGRILNAFSTWRPSSRLESI